MLEIVKETWRNLCRTGDAHRGVPPSFLIVGAQKAGTTALFRYLAKHPCIKPPEVKEIDFFSCTARYSRGEEFYHSHFPAASSLPDGGSTFEASPSYLVNESAPARIHAYNARIRLVAILRDPVERAYSAWNMYEERFRRDKNWLREWTRRCEGCAARKGVRTRQLTRFDSFEAVISEEEEAIASGEAIEAPVLLHGFYSEQLQRYFEYFDPKQILVVESSALRDDPVECLGEVERFLALQPHDWSQEDTAPVFEGTYSDPIPEAAAARLREFYRTHNAALYELLGQQFDW